MWLCRDTELSRDVALKFLHGESPEELERFQREARTAGRLSHPNIVPVYDVGEDHGEPYIVMGYVAGAPANAVRTDPRRAADLIRQAAEAVHHAHENGVIHRDLKPHNLLVTGDPPRVMVTDFGLAKSLSDKSLSMTGDIMGTPHYMAPEQARGQVHAVDARTDVYGLGATLFSLCTGEPPFGATTDVYELLQRVVNADPPAALGTDPDLNTIIHKCLEKSPVRRYATARELADDLGRYLSGEPIAAHPPSTFYRVGKHLRKRKALWIVGAAGAAAVAAALSIVLPMWGRARRAQELWSRTANPWTEAQLYARQGFTDRADERLDEAIRECRAAVDEDDSAMARYFLGRFLRERGKIEEAEAELVRAVEMDPELGEAHFELGLVLVARYDALAEQIRTVASLHFKEVPSDPRLDELARRAVRHFSTPAGVSSYFREVDRLYGSGELQRLTGNLDEAQRILEDVVGRDPLYVEALASLAGIEEFHDRIDRAIEIHTQAIERHKGFARSYQRRSILRADVAPGKKNPEAEFELAVEDATRAIEIRPRSTDAYQARATAFSAWGRWLQTQGRDPHEPLHRGTADLDAALGLDPHDAQALIHRGNLVSIEADRKHRNGEDPWETFQRLLADYDAAIATDSALFSAHLNRGLAYLDMAERAPAWGRDPFPFLLSAQADFGRIIEMNPQAAFGYAYRGRAFMEESVERERLGQDPMPSCLRARDDYDKAAALNDDAPDTYASRAEVLAYLAEASPEDAAGLFEMAVDSCSRAVELTKGAPDGLLARANVFLRQARLDLARGGDARRRLDAALDDCNAALAIDARSADAFRIRGSAYYQISAADAADGADPIPSLRKCAADHTASLHIDPTCFDAYFNRAMARHYLSECLATAGGDAAGTVVEAIADFDAADRLQPRTVLVFAYRGDAYLTAGDIEAQAGRDGRPNWRKALEDFERLQRLTPESADACKYVGTAHFSLGEFDAAGAAWSRASELDPAQAAALAPLIEEARRLSPP